MSHPLDDLLTSHHLTPVVAGMTPGMEGPVSFSVIVRTQGRRPGALRDALVSLSAQTHDDFDVVVVVHGSLDTTATVRTSLEEAIVPARMTVTSVEGGGRSRPLNTGLDEATGDYVCFLDDDDLVTPDWLAAFVRGAAREPGTVIRAVTGSQEWSTDGTEEPVRPTGDVEHPFAAEFDLLAHMSRNDTPICAVALPRVAMADFGIRFDENLPVLEDWDVLMRIAMLVGVTSIPDQTSLYRRLDHGNAHTAEEELVWRQSHAAVIDRLSSRPVLLPVGDARRVASAHFLPGRGSRHDDELAEARDTVDRLTRSPWRWARAFGSRAARAARHRTARRGRQER